jgi:hypothetical protein
MQALFAMPPQQQPAQFANPFAQRTAAVGAPPSPSVVIMNIPAEFNTAAALENLCRYHFNRGPRTCRASLQRVCVGCAGRLHGDP